MTTEEIHNICNKYNITNYTINEDLSIDVDGNVSLCYRRLKKLPWRFRNVSGWFDCSWNNLTTLDGAPSYIGGNYFCDNNNLKSLKGAPSYFQHLFNCYNNPLESLKGIPLNISDDYLVLPENLTYSDYLAYCRDIKFKKILK